MPMIVCACGRLNPKGQRCPCKTARDAAYEQARGSATERGYDGAWRKASKAFLAAHPVCVSCDKSATLVDHVTAHKGDRVLFWDRSNWQPMCASCHGRKTVREDGGWGKAPR